MAKQAKQPSCDCVRSIRYAENLKKDLCAECEEKNKQNEIRISSLEKKVTAFMLMFAVTATIIGKNLMEDAGESMQSMQTLQEKAESVVEKPSEKEAEVAAPQDKVAKPSKLVPEVPVLNPFSQNSSGGSILRDGNAATTTSSMPLSDRMTIDVATGNANSLVEASKTSILTQPTPKIEWNRLDMPVELSSPSFQMTPPRPFSEDLSPKYLPIPSPGGFLLMGMSLILTGVRPQR